MPRHQSACIDTGLMTGLIADEKHALQSDTYSDALKLVK
jgi:hypothetical protein